MRFQVRKAEEGDGEELLELWHGFTARLSEYDERYEHQESADERWLSYFQKRLVDSKYGAVFVAEHDDEIVGVVEARVTGGHPIFRIEDHGYVNGYFVREAHRGEGVGEALMEACEDWFASPPREVPFYRVDVLEGDEEGAAFCRDAGLEPVEHVYEKRIEGASDP